VVRCLLDWARTLCYDPVRWPAGARQDCLSRHSTARGEAHVSLLCPTTSKAICRCGMGAYSLQCTKRCPSSRRFRLSFNHMLKETDVHTGRSTHSGRHGGANMLLFMG
jgi:hypothetical protein